MPSACRGGSLEIASALEPSSIGGLIVEHGTLTGSGEVKVTRSFLGGDNGSLERAGATVLRSGVSGNISESLRLAKSTFVNEGSLLLNGGSAITGTSGSSLVNDGALTVNSEGSASGLQATEVLSPPTLTNSGTLQKTEGTGTTVIGFAIDNEATVRSFSGTLQFINGTSTEAKVAGSWSATTPGTKIEYSGGNDALGPAVSFFGFVTVAGAHVTVGKIEGSLENLLVTALGERVGVLTITSARFR